MKTFNKILSTGFRLLTIYLICFVWFRYYFDLVLALFLSGALTLLIDFFITLTYKRKNIKASLKDEEQKKAENYANSFIFADDKKSVDFFYNLALKKHNAKKSSKFVTIEYETSRVVLYPFYTIRSFLPEDLVHIYNQANKVKATKLVVCVNEIDPQAEKLAKLLDLKILLLDKYDTYKKLMVSYGCFPEEMALKEIKPSVSSLVEYSLNRKRTKGYFFSSLILLFSSFIVRYNIYYVIFSSLLLILSLFSFFNPKFNKKIPENII